MARETPRLYSDLAEWFHLLTAPEEYAEEAAIYLRDISEALGRTPDTLLELGSGGGNNAWHYKHWVPRVTLTDLSPGVLELSAKINPECEHVHGDMRTLRLGREFDAIFVHDAVSYMTSENDLRAAMETAFIHCRAGGVALFAPDHVRENFREDTEHGGHDGDDGRALRYLIWTYDPDPDDGLYSADFVYVLHERGQLPRSVYDQHVLGLFSRVDWLRLFDEVGFDARVRPFEHSELPPGAYELFVALKRQA